MKEIKELKFEELSTRQKLGMTMMAHIDNYGPEITPANNQYVYDLVKEHALGAVYVHSLMDGLEDVMKTLHEIADYPLLIVADAESGIGNHTVGRHNAIGCTGSPELAYMFGKVTGITARKLGYNVVCDPVVDMSEGNAVCGHTVRCLGGDKHKVSELAVNIAQGLKDAGVLSVAKHYPSAKGDGKIDSHMAEVLALETKEELLNYNLFPYLAMLKNGLLDGIMTGHVRLPNIDPDYPASLSEKVIGIIREQGFDGIAVTDALTMMGVVAKFGERTSKGLAIANGNDLALTWCLNKDGFEAICETYEKGLIPEARLDEAVRRVLDAQHKTLSAPKYEDLTDEDISTFDRINRESIFARIDEGLSQSLEPNGRHYFVVLAENDVEVSDQGKVNVDVQLKGWFRPNEVATRLDELFPNSVATIINQFPSPAQIMYTLERSVPYDDVVFVTFMESQAYVGRECLTSRVVSTIEALQITNRVSTVVHFGNPYVLEELPHIPRIIIGCLSYDSVRNTLDVLAGKYSTKGVLTYDVSLR